MELILQDYFNKKETKKSLEDIYKEVLKENKDLMTATESNRQQTRLLKKFGYLEKDSKTYIIEEIFNPFKTIPDSLKIDKKKLNIVNENISLSETLNYLDKLGRRALFNTTGYRVARKFLEETQLDPVKNIEQLGFDETDLVTALNDEFKIFIESSNYYSDVLKKVTDEIKERRYLSKLEPHISTSIAKNYLNIILGGKIPNKENGEITERAMGFKGIICDSWLYNSFPEEIVNLIKIRKDFEDCELKFYKSLEESKKEIVKKANIENKEYGEMTKKSLEDIITVFEKRLDVTNKDKELKEISIYG